MIRPQEIRGAGGFATRQRGFDKHWGRALCYITVNRNLYWWTRITVNTAITLRENTDACSPIRQYQIIREEAISIDLESMIPGASNAMASSFMHDFRQGVIVDRLFADVLQDLFNTTASGTTADGAVTAASSAYGAFVIERSNAEVSRDDFSTLRLTIRSLGYGDSTIIEAAVGDYDASLAANYDTDTVDPELDDEEPAGP